MIRKGRVDCPKDRQKAPSRGPQHLLGSIQLTRNRAFTLTAVLNVWPDPPQGSMGYQFTTPICNPGSHANTFPGAAQVGICLAPINPTPSN